MYPKARRSMPEMCSPLLNRLRAHSFTGKECRNKRMTEQTDLRILLWDIDGTLIRSARQGAFKEYTIPFLEKVFGTSGRLNELSVSGMTDLQIIGEALRDEGFTHEQIRGRVDDIREHYIVEMRRATAD